MSRAVIWMTRLAARHAFRLQKPRFSMSEWMAIPNVGVRLVMRHFLKVSDQVSTVFAEIKHDQPTSHV